MKIEGSSALVTGANRGLGAAIAQALLDSGAKVYGAARDLKKITNPESHPDPTRRDQPRRHRPRRRNMRRRVDRGQQRWYRPELLSAGTRRHRRGASRDGDQLLRPSSGVASLRPSPGR